MESLTIGKNAKKHIKMFLKERAALKDKSYSAVLIQPYEDVSNAVELFLRLDKQKRASTEDLVSTVEYIEKRIGNMQHHLTRIYSYIKPLHSTLYSFYYRDSDPSHDLETLIPRLTMALKAIRALYYHIHLYKDYDDRIEFNSLVSSLSEDHKEPGPDYASYMQRLQRVHFLNLLLLEDVDCKRLFSYPLQDFYGINAPSSNINRVHYVYYLNKWYIYFIDKQSISREGYLCPIESLKYPSDLFQVDNLYKVKNKESVTFFYLG